MTGRAAKPDSELDRPLTVREGRLIGEHNRRLVERFGRRLVALAMMVTVLAVVQIVIGYLNDRASCERGQGVRSALNFASEYFDGAANRAATRAALEAGRRQLLDQRAAVSARHAAIELRVPQLRCDQAFPAVR